MAESIYGYEIRKPMGGEDTYFRAQRNVAGMAAEDGKIVLNPYSPNTKKQQMLVAKNEAIRLWLRDNEVDLDFDVTPDQVSSFAGTAYEKPENREHLKATLVARWLTGDSSAGAPTQIQQSWADHVKKLLPE